MRKITTKLVEWSSDNSPAARLERTIAQGVIGVVIGGLTTGEWTGACIVGLAMAILSPVQALIGKGLDKED